MNAEHVSSLTNTCSPPQKGTVNLGGPQGGTVLAVRQKDGAGLPVRSL